MIVNLQRDCHFVAPAGTGLQFSTERVIDHRINAQADPAVYDSYAACFADQSTSPSVTAGSWRSIGCYVKQPVLDAGPYRIKAYIGASWSAAIVVGYPPASHTGNDDLITPVQAISFVEKMDDVFLVPVLPEGDPLEDRPLYFGIAITDNKQSDRISCSLSVQRLATTPPPFMQSVS